MKVDTHDEVEQKTVEMPGAVGCRVRQLIGEEDGAKNFSMRHFEVEEGGHTPLHSHPYEHEIFVVEGFGAAIDGNREWTIERGDVIYVAPGDVHQFKNMGDGPLSFLCLIPNSAANLPITQHPEYELE